MPRIDVTKVDEASDFTPIPDGTYPCECVEVEVKKTKNGDDMWAVKWSVIGGEFDGKNFYDNLVFTEAAMSRVKMVAKRVAGIDVDSGPFDFEPYHIEGKRAMIEVEINDYVDDKGKKRQNNKPTFGGYNYYDEGADGGAPASSPAKSSAPAPAGKVPPPF